MKIDRVTVAAVQMVSSDDVDENLGLAGELLAQAAGKKASVAVLPENFAFMGRSDADRIAMAEAESPSAPIQRFLSEQAASHGIWLVGGTVPLRSPHEDRVYSACLCYSPDGRCAARYDKIHLFDVALPGGGAQYNESRSTVSGSRAVVARSPLGGIGLAVCYDLRFPELFRAVAGPDLSLFAVCSAFTPSTGAAHWETLVRARAIENLTAVVAASQGGDHTAGRQTWGHSMIVDGWGRVLAERDSGAGVLVADIDLAGQRQLRKSFPVLAHRRDQIIRAKDRQDDN